MVCVVTGGRVRIGFAIVLKLLRAGAFVLTTTRYPNDCVRRFASEQDYEMWRKRLEVCGPVELCDLKLVEKFCDHLVSRFPRIHVLINNAAQTLTRPEGWHERMADLDVSAAATLSDDMKALLQPPLQGIASICAPPLTAVPASKAEEVLSAAGSKWQEAAEQLKDFPDGGLDESRQPLDLSAANSWSRRLGQVSTLELLQTLAANTAAPFIMISRLTPIIAPAAGTESYGHIINVR